MNAVLNCGNRKPEGGFIRRFAQVQFLIPLLFCASAFAGSDVYFKFSDFTDRVDYFTNGNGKFRVKMTSAITVRGTNTVLKDWVDYTISTNGDRTVTNMAYGIYSVQITAKNTESPFQITITNGAASTLNARDLMTVSTNSPEGSVGYSVATANSIFIPKTNGVAITLTVSNRFILQPTNGAPTSGQVWTASSTNGAGFWSTPSATPSGAIAAAAGTGTNINVRSNIFLQGSSSTNRIYEDGLEFAIAFRKTNGLEHEWLVYTNVFGGTAPWLDLNGSVQVNGNFWHLNNYASMNQIYAKNFAIYTDVSSGAGSTGQVFGVASRIFTIQDAYGENYWLRYDGAGNTLSLNSGVTNNGDWTLINWLYSTNLNARWASSNLFQGSLASNYAFSLGATSTNSEVVLSNALNTRFTSISNSAVASAGSAATNSETTLSNAFNLRLLGIGTNSTNNDLTLGLSVTNHSSNALLTLSNNSIAVIRSNVNVVSNLVGSASNTLWKIKLNQTNSIANTMTNVGNFVLNGAGNTGDDFSDNGGGNIIQFSPQVGDSRAKIVFDGVGGIIVDFENSQLRYVALGGHYFFNANTSLPGGVTAGNYSGYGNLDLGTLWTNAIAAMAVQSATGFATNLVVGTNGGFSALQIIRENSAAGMLTNEAHLQIETPAGGQAEVVFSFAGVTKGGIRADSAGGFNYHGAGSQTFWIDATGSDAANIMLYVTSNHIALGKSRSLAATEVVDVIGNLMVKSNGYMRLVARTNTAGPSAVAGSALIYSRTNAGISETFTLNSSGTETVLSGRTVQRTNMVINRDYTNSTPWWAEVKVSVDLINSLVLGQAQAAIMVDDTADGAYDATNLVMASSALVQTNTAQVSVSVPPNGKWVITNLTTGGASALIRNGSSQIYFH